MKRLFEADKAEIVKQAADEKVKLTKQGTELTEKDRTVSEELRHIDGELTINLL